MSHPRLIVLGLAIAVLPVGGCGDDPKVSAANDEEMRESIEEVKRALPGDRRAEFEDALKTLVFADVEGLQDFADPEGMARRMRDKVDGKSAEEIISAAEQVKAERKERERRQATSEIEELRARLASERGDVLDRFVVERARFRRRSDSWLGGVGIELAVRNETGSAISQAHFHALLLTPGRAVSWVDTEFNYDIPGGLEPREPATWNLSVSSGSWDKLPDDRHDFVFVVRPVELKGPDGEPITGQRFQPFHETRLRALAESIDYEDADEVLRDLDERARAFAEWRDAAVVETARSELERLRKEKAVADGARDGLASFVVERSRFYWSEDRFTKEPVIDVTVHNGTGEVVSRFYARGVLSSPGREMPWVDETFNYSVQGGIEQGETRQFKLAPNKFGEWGRAPKDRHDMVLTVEITRLDSADSEQLFDAEFSEDDEKRVAALSKMVAEQGWE